MNLTDRWPISCFDEDAAIRDNFKDNENCILAKKTFEGDYEGVPANILHAAKIYQSNMQKMIVESLMSSEDCDIAEISTLTGVGEDALIIYGELFFRKDFVFISKIDFLDFIETGIKEYSDNQDEDNLTLFLMKRWAVSLGKEFVIWRYRLKPIAYAPATLYSTITKEAFFYHKEKSMGNKDISLSEYLRSTNTLLAGIKNSTAIKEVSEEDAELDMLERLDIIMKDKEAPAITLEEIANGEFVNNAINQEVT